MAAKKLSKAQREKIRQKFGGRCAYCGHELTSTWQVDHVVPVYREHKWVRQENGTLKSQATGVMLRPQHDHEDNMFPACRSCNNDKFSMSLEQWRRRLEDLVGVCERNHSAFRHAVRFGLVLPRPGKVVFHFETYSGHVQPDPGRAPVVCLCGSTKFPDAHHRANMEETLNGNIVLAMGVYGHADFPAGAKEVTSDSDHSHPVKARLDELHRRKIETCDELVVVVVDGYTGSGTKADIDYGTSLGKAIRYRHYQSSDFRPPDQDDQIQMRAVE